MKEIKNNPRRALTSTSRYHEKCVIDKIGRKIKHKVKL